MYYHQIENWDGYFKDFEMNIPKLNKTENLYLLIVQLNNKVLQIESFDFIK